METVYVARHIHALSLAKSCAELGARIKSISHITGIGHNELVRVLFVDEFSAPRGRPPDSPEWYHQANLVEKVEACVFAAIYMRIRSLGFGPAEALIGAYKIYRERCALPPRINFDRAFELVCHIQGIWAQQRPQLALNTCSACQSQFITAIGDHSGGQHDCPFCKLIKRYAYDQRLQASFPERPVPDATVIPFGWFSRLFRTNP